MLLGVTISSSCVHLVSHDWLILCTFISCYGCALRRCQYSTGSRQHSMVGVRT